MNNKINITYKSKYLNKFNLEKNIIFLTSAKDQ